ncbi:MAG: right-handed parallel beta-helix repeat-containing protein [Holophagales bacterium]|nr:right-handed parallel beta-helix repeat-containing protein [Holophagales bacterium]
MIRSFLLSSWLLLAAVPSMARLPSDAPPLPSPDPEVYTLLTVSTAQELADACWNLSSNQAIVIAPGTYDLASVTFPNGVDGRLTVGRFGAPPISNIQIRGATHDPRDVVLLGAGMLDPIVPFGIQIFTATDVLVANLSIGDVYFHGVAIQSEQGAARIRLYNTRIFDAGQQIVKGTSGGGQGAPDVSIEYSEIFYTDGAVVHPQGSPPNTCYTNGIDALAASDWVIRHNLIRGIRCRNLELAGPAILIWGGSSGTLVEGNTLLDSSRGIHLGLLEADHTGGMVRNNFVRWRPDAPYQVDVGIYTTSAGARILHNTVLTRERYPNAIEVRYSTASGVVAQHNLTDAAIQPRNGAVPTLIDNLTTAQPGWFADEATGDLHLLPEATAALDQVTRLPDAERDFDEHPRPEAPGASDLGGSELEAGDAIFADGFEAGNTSSWG